MTKKNSKVAPNQLQEYNNVVEEERPSSAPKRPGSEIDEIFAGQRRQKSEPERTRKPDEDVTKTHENTKKKKKKRNKKNKGSDDVEFLELNSKPGKRTEDGLAIYTEEELGINKADAGNTPLCPFDCSCCF